MSHRNGRAGRQIGKIVSRHLGHLAVSVAVTLLALLTFGYVKGRFTTPHPFRSAWQTALVGGLAAGAAFLIAKLVERG